MSLDIQFGGNEGVGAVEADAFRRLFPLQYIERYLDASVRPDGRPLGRARPTSISLGAMPTTDGSALVKVGNTTMLAGIRLEVFVPPAKTPDKGRIAVCFQMPNITSSFAFVRPGWHDEVREVDICINEQLSNALISSELVDLCELLILNGKAAWVAYLDIYCLDADGALLDAALLASVAALANLQIPPVSVNDDGKVQRISSSVIDEQEHGATKAAMEVDDNSGEQVQMRPKQTLKLRAIPVSFTFVLHKKYLLADPTGEEEAVLKTTLTVVLDSAGRLISMYKPGGLAVATTATVHDCLALARHREREVRRLLEAALLEEG